MDLSAYHGGGQCTHGRRQSATFSKAQRGEKEGMDGGKSLVNWGSHVKSVELKKQQRIISGEGDKDGKKRKRNVGSGAKEDFHLQKRALTYLVE